MEAIRAELERLRSELDEEKRLRQQLQNGAVGGQTGQETTILQMNPPSLDETDNFHVWKKFFNVWEAGTGARMTDKAKAAAVMQTITDHHKGHKLGLKTLMMEKFTDEQTKNPTMELVMDFLEEQLVTDQYEEMYRLWRQWIECEIKPGEKWTAFVIRFDTRWQALKQKDPDLNIPDKVLVLRLRDAAKLSSANLMGLRTNVKWDSTTLYEDTKRAINQICASESFKAHSAQVKLVTAEGEDDIRYQQGCYFINGQQVTTRQELFAISGNDKSGRKEKKGREKISCWNCNKSGHYASECTEERKKPTEKSERKAAKKKKSKPQVKFETDTEDEENHFMEGVFTMEAIETEVISEDEWEVEGDNNLVLPDHYYSSKASHRSGRTSNPGMSTLISQTRTNTNSYGDPDNYIDIEEDNDEECYVNIGPKKAKNFRAEAEGAAGLDTCCSRTVCGEEWFKDYCRALPKYMREELEGPYKTSLTFKFGDDKHLSSLGRYKIPVEIHGVKARLLVETVPSDIPLLLSKSTMSKAGAVINLKERTVEIFGVRQNLRETSLGHPIVSVIPKKREPFITDQILTLEVGEKVETSVEQQKKDIRKIHKQAGHPSKAKMKDFLRKGSRKWDKKVVNEELDHLAENCRGCQMKKRTPDKPAACIPMADGFNQVVGVDLRIKGDGLIILYIIDIWSKLMVARVVKTKRSEEIVTAILEAWISVYGAPDSFLHDNGGEFIGESFRDLSDLLGIVDKTTGAHSPWSAGVVERHHAVADACLDSLIKDFPEYSTHTLLAWAMMIKNSQVSNKGWSPFQVVFGRNPSLPNLLDSPISAMREETTSKALRENMNSLMAARTKFNEALCDVRVAKMLKSKVRRNQVVFQAGDKVVWRAHNTDQKWERGKVLAADGKLLFVRKGGRLYRVSADMALKEGQEFDRNGEPLNSEEDDEDEEIPIKQKKLELKKEKKFSFVNIPRRRSARLASREEDTQPGAGRDGGGGGEVPALPGQGYDTTLVLHGPGRAQTTGTSPVNDTNTNDVPPHDVDNSADAGDPFDAPDPPAAEVEVPGVPDKPEEDRREAMEEELREENNPALLGQTHDAPLFPGSSRAPQTGEPHSPSQTAANIQHTHDSNTNHDEIETDVFAEERPEQDQDRRDEMRVMVYNELQDARKRKADSSPPSSVRKPGKIPRQPCTGQRLSVKPGEIIQAEDPSGNMKVSKVLSREKVKGKYYNCFNLEPQDGSKPYNIDLGRAQWQRWRQPTGESDEEMLTMDGVQEEIMMNLIPFKDHGNQECMEAKRVEIKKIVEEFKAVKVVDDVGQFRISSRFVLWHKKHSNGEIQTRARLVCRGFEERDMGIISDSPTLDHSSFKIIIGVAHAKGMELESGDVKSAFLQGTPFTDKDRVVTVKPPPEAGLPKNKLWQLVISLYGLDDASLRFFLKTKEVFTKLGLRQSKYDPCLFLDKTKDGELKGMIGTHVDDFLMAGTREWLDNIIKKIKENFLMGKVESTDYLYCGHRIKLKDGKLTLDQREFVKDIKPLIIAPGRKKQDDAPVTEKERSTIRSYAGKLGWLGRTTRPDILFPQIEASSTVTKATVRNLKDLSKAVGRIFEADSIQTVPRLSPDISKWKLLCHSDAAWQNIAVTGSTAGRVMVLTDGDKNYPLHWGTNRIRRVCHSSQQAEIMAANIAVGEATYLTAVLEEMMGVDVPVELYIDNKNAFSTITATTAPTDKKVRREASGIREALIMGEVKKIALVKTTEQLADSLTKKKANGTNLLHLVQTGGRLEEALGH